MDIKTEEYNIIYDSTTTTVVCDGSLFLNSIKEYEPILELFKKAAEENKFSKTFTVDLRELQFLNSSGINMMIKFVSHVAEGASFKFKLVVKGQKENLFHEKLLKNFQCLMPSLVVQLE
ncbi:hypothetical protein [Candidatus Parabeggiatoa sp. HSG14]|uniref:slr1659 superfamily regulator n=1 Tax=Candidatus Parabeggiatoa sp. HSG14 TaxID=3055593 RepID=UPI0025A84756|nr:hypothetical protein [Thiotrichales bacterium HSG14]